LFYTLPFIGGNDPWNKIERKNPLYTVFNAIDGKGYSLIAEKDIDDLPAGSDIFKRKLAEPVYHFNVMIPRFPVSRKHFVKKTVGGCVVSLKQTDHFRMALCF
jgi:hypothetical protein